MEGTRWRCTIVMKINHFSNTWLILLTPSNSELCSRTNMVHINVPVQVIYSQTGYPKLMLDGYFYRPHNAYRNQPKVLWYCAARNKFQCNATLRTYNREVVAVAGAHNHDRWQTRARAPDPQRMRELSMVHLREIFRLYGERLGLRNANVTESSALS